MELTIELPDLIAEKVQARTDRQEFFRHARRDRRSDAGERDLR